MDDEHKKAIADWVAQGLKAAGKSQIGLARELGITQPQIVRLLRGERSLRAEEIAKVEKYLDAAFPFGQIFASENTITDGMAGQMPVVYRVQAGVWVEQDAAIDEPIGTIPFARDPAFPPGRRQYAVQVMGDSMDKVLPEGAYAIVLEADGKAPTHNDLVVVRRTHRGLVERTVKRYCEGPSGPELRPESNNPRHKALPLAGDSDSTVEIEAFVIGRYERLSR